MVIIIINHLYTKVIDNIDHFPISNGPDEISSHLRYNAILGIVCVYIPFYFGICQYWIVEYA